LEIGRSELGQDAPAYGLGLSFLPVFLLEAQEGRMFRPLAWTKTLAVGFSSVLAISLVPVLMILFIRGKLRPESKNPISRVTQANYLPVLRLCFAVSQNDVAAQFAVFDCDVASGSQDWQPVHAAIV
jgi:Cu/Ag efflux pump CusA